METLHDDFLRWNNSFRSLSTSKNYRGTLKQFTQLTFEKEPWETTLDDWKGLEYNTIREKYIKRQRGRDVSERTIRASFVGVRSFVGSLEGLTKGEKFRLKEEILVHKNHVIKNEHVELRPNDVAKALLLYQAMMDDTITVKGWHHKKIKNATYEELKEHFREIRREKPYKLV